MNEMVMLHLGIESQMTEMFVVPSRLLLAVVKILSQIESLFKDASYGVVIFAVTVSGLRTVPWQLAVGKISRSQCVRVVTHNPPRVVTPISPCGISVINKKAHGRKCWLCLWISSLFPTRDAVEILLWSSIGERVTKLVFPAGQFSR